MVIWGAFLSAMMAADPGNKLVIVDPKMSVSAAGEKMIIGTVSNRSSRSYADVEVRIDLFDANGAPLEGPKVIVGELESRSLSGFGVEVDQRVESFRASVFSPENVRPEWFGGCSTKLCQIFQ